MADSRVPFGVPAVNTAAMTADNACHGWTALEIGPAYIPQRMFLDGLPTPTDHRVVPDTCPIRWSVRDS